ncbi:fungal-specific transcription factor domain-containing protein [Lipomyces kononenkoae]
MKAPKDVASRPHKRYESKVLGEHSAHELDSSNASSSDAQTSSASTGSGVAPTHLTRIISACSRCRSRKTKCDQKFPSCSACSKAGVECVGLDAATGREVPRSYVSHLEDRVAFLEIQLQNQGIPVDTTDTSLRRAQAANLALGEAAAKGPAAIAPDTDSHPAKDVDSLVSTVGLVSMKGSSSLSSPSFLGLSSGISFARLMFAAVKLRGQDVPSAALSIASSEQPDFTIQHKQVKIQPAPLPPKDVAETLLEVFFNQANAQIPIFHRGDFIHAYFEPVYGSYSVETKLANISNVRNDSVSPKSNLSPPVDTTKSPTTTTVKTEFTPSTDAAENYNAQSNGHVHNGIYGNMHEHTANSPETLRALYFLNLIFAIGVAVHQQQYPALLCESYHAAAMKHIEPVFASLDRLESLQGILLLGLYSIMRPAVPGVWYVLGVALRLCVDLGLHVEGGVKTWSGTNITPKNGQGPIKEGDGFDARTLDLRRRLFWCTYAMDRQVCVYLGRPFGIADNSIKVPFPSDLDDVFITSEGIMKPPEDTPPSYKQVAVHIFQIRRLQSEIQTILYERAELPRRFATLKEWQTNMARRLEEWNNTAPKSTKDMNCNFNLYFLDLNYQQTRLLLHGISPAIPRPSVEAFFIIADASEKVIRAYRQLHREKNINYTWMAVHNLFMAGTSYLYCLYHSKEVRSRTRMDVIDFNTMACIHVLTAMVDKCDAASGCRDTFELLTAAILRLCYNEKAAAGEIIASAGVTGADCDPRTGGPRTVTPPIPPPMPPPSKRSKRTSWSSRGSTQRPQQIEMPRAIPTSQTYPALYSKNGAPMDFPSGSPPVASSASIGVPNMADAPMQPAGTPGSQASTPTSSTTESVRTTGQGGLSPFASFESNTLQWMTDMEPDLDEIFRTAAEIQAVPPMHGNFTHPVAYSGNVSGNTQGGGYAYQFSPGTAIQQQSPNDHKYGTLEGSPSRVATTSQVDPAVTSQSATLSPGGTPFWPRPSFSGVPVQSYGVPQQQQQQQQQLFDDEYDGQRIYEMMYELPSASIWDQFFAVAGNANFASVAGPGLVGLGAPNIKNGSPVSGQPLPAAAAQANPNGAVNGYGVPSYFDVNMQR